MSDQGQAFRNFQLALDALLGAHGERFGEHSRLVLDARPGIFVLSEVDQAEGEQPRLMLHCDSREPATFGQRIEVLASGAK